MLRDPQWRKSVRFDKFKSAQAKLQGGLFMLDDVLSDSLREVRSRSCDLLDGKERLTLYSLTQASVYRLAVREMPPNSMC